MNQCKECRYYDDEYPLVDEPKGRGYCWKNDVAVWDYEECTEWEKTPQIVTITLSEQQKEKMKTFLLDFHKKNNDQPIHP